MTYVQTDLLDTEGAARHCGVSKSTLEKLRLTGGGPRYLKPSRSVRYRVADLDAWLESRAYRSTSEYPQEVAA